MNTGKTLFSQLISFAPKYIFNKAVAKYSDKYAARTFSYWDQFLCMAFAQVTHRESLRDIESSLRSAGTKLFLLGIRGKVSKSTLSDANEKRDWRIFAEFGQALMKEAQALYADDELFIEEISQAVYAMDSTNIDLCLSLFPWARFDPTRAGIRIDTLLDLNGNLPCFIQVSTRKTSELTGMDAVTIYPGSFYIFDRGYFDWERLYRFSSSLAYFVIRAKKDIKYKRQRSLEIENKDSGVRSDQIILPFSPRARRHYVGALRRVTYFDSESGNRFAFFTNHLTLPPEKIAELYKSRWQIELFFKWIKQHLRIKAFYGTSFNAIKIQIWVAISTYLLFAIAKKRLGINVSLYTFSQTLSVAAFEKTPLIVAFQHINCHSQDENTGSHSNQLNLFGFPTGQ